MLTLMKRFVAVGTALTLTVAVLSPGSAWAATPGAPTALTAGPGNAQVALTWTAPTGSPGCSTGCTDYYIEYSPDAGVTYHRFIDAVSTTAAVTVTGLTNGTLYRFRVSALNNADVGPASAIVTATPFVTHTAGNAATYSACPPTGIIPAAGFSDVTSTAVNCIKYYGITKGTTATTYSPYDKVTRWQMALFLTRLGAKAGITLPDGAAQGFSDISGYSAEIQTAVNQIKQLGITTGKTATTYDPASFVTREEMALFLSRLLKAATVGPGGHTEFISGLSGPKHITSSATTHNFVDLTGLMLYESVSSVASLWNLGVTDYPTGNYYEPVRNITRKEMATMMANALSHTNARPVGLTIQADFPRASGTNKIMSITYRDSNFMPIAGALVDTFRFTQTTVATTVDFVAATGYCSSTVATSVGSIKCKVDAGDPATDAYGNLTTFYEFLPTYSFVDFWAWTAATGTVYDNDIHASSAGTITVEVLSG